MSRLLHKRSPRSDTPLQRRKVCKTITCHRSFLSLLSPSLRAWLCRIWHGTRSSRRCAAQSCSDQSSAHPTRKEFPISPFRSCRGPAGWAADFFFSGPFIPPNKTLAGLPGRSRTANLWSYPIHVRFRPRGRADLPPFSLLELVVFYRSAEDFRRLPTSVAGRPGRQSAVSWVASAIDSPLAMPPRGIRLRNDFFESSFLLYHSLKRVQDLTRTASRFVLLGPLSCPSVLKKASFPGVLFCPALSRLV